MLPDGVTGRFSYTPNAGGSGAADKASSGAGDQKGSGYDITLSLTDAILGVPGLKLDVGMADISQDSTKANYDGDIDRRKILEKN
jgi:hypothetical protein